MQLPISSLLLTVLSLTLSLNLRAATVTVCDENSLRTALIEGGAIKFGCDGTIVLSSTLQVATNAVIDATGHTVVISGGDAVRVFFVATNIDLVITNLTIANGRQNGFSSAGGASESALGAGIFNDGGHVQLVDCSLSSNFVFGVTEQADDPKGGDAMGAAIYNSGGSVSLIHCSAAGNICRAGIGASRIAPASFAKGAAIYSREGVVSIADSEFESNSALGEDGSGGPMTTFVYLGSGCGGAVFAEGGTIGITQTRFVNNQAKGGSNTLFSASTIGIPGTAQGGAVYLTNCDATISFCQFLTNSAVAGAAPVSFPGGSAQGGAVFNAGNLNLTDTFLVNNSSTGGSGAQGGGESQGGALCNIASVMVARCKIETNEVQGGYGRTAALARDLSPGADGKGGGIYNSGILSAVNSTIAFNRVLGGAGGNSFFGSVAPSGNGQGGAIYNMGDFFGTNNTIALNLAGGGPFFQPYTNQAGIGKGGGVFNEGNMTLVHATVASNSTEMGGFLTGSDLDFVPGKDPGLGGAIFTTNGLSTLQNTIIANSLSGSNSFGPLIDSGNNLGSDESCQFTAPGSVNSTDPLLSSLDEFGGPTPTMALLAGSPALDKGLTDYCPPTDQRGIFRPYGSACDIGAFESAPPYSVRGFVLGSSAVGSVRVVQGANSTTIATPGSYSLGGLVSGTYTISPSTTNGVAIPNSRTLTVGSDVIGVNFKVYQFNALTIESYTNQVLHFIFAGTNGQTTRVQFSTNLMDWITTGTNTVQTNGIFDFYSTNNLIETSSFFRAVTP